MKYIFMLMQGSRHTKTHFIYKMIAFENKESFTYMDLVNFYKLVNKEDDL